VFDLPFEDPTMATNHADIERQGEDSLVRDLGSPGGVRLNGIAIRGAHRLAEGDVIRLGDTSMVYTGSEADPGSRATSAPDDVVLNLAGSTESIAAVNRSIDAVARHQRTVVVSGETGTGKEIVSRLIHHRSGRTGPFVAVNCGGFTEGLLASELFGHVRGAFTGAVSEQQGLFRSARGGTLLLDEAGEIPLPLQPTLLRVLETWKVRPVGSAQDVPVDVRVIAASNRELATLVQKGLFRADLYARLAQWIIRIPPLKDHRPDIPELTRSLLARFGEAKRQMTPDLQEALLIHPWPLNVRGLANVLSIASIATPSGEPLGLGPEVLEALADNRLQVATVAPEAAQAVLDRAGLEDLLMRFNGRVAEAARHLGISRPKLYRMLWAIELDPAQFRKR
jgi:DNA-binding NtrC family response regulator